MHRPKSGRATLSGLRKISSIGLLAMTIILLASPAGAAPESPNELMDKVRAIDARVKKIEETQKEILEHQKEIQASVDNLRVWIRSS